MPRTPRCCEWHALGSQQLRPNSRGLADLKTDGMRIALPENMNAIKLDRLANAVSQTTPNKSGISVINARRFVITKVLV